MYVCIIYL
jgi:hypothetical protein